VTVTGANIVLLIFASIFIAYQLIVSILFGDRVFTDNIYLMLLVNEILLILAPVLIYAFIKKVNIRETFRFNRPGLMPVLVITLISPFAYFVAAMLNNILCYFLQFLGKIPSNPIPIPGNLTELIVGLLFVAVLPGVCEEMLHRGLLLRAYEKRGSYKAVVIVAIFFGIFHMDVTNFLGPVFLGLIIGYYVIRTNSIFAGMLAHFLNNAISELIQFYSDKSKTPEYTTISSQDLLVLVLCGITGLIITLLLISVFKRVTEGRYAVVPPISSIKKDITAVLSHWPVIILLVLYFILLLLYLLTIVMLKLNS